VGGAGVLGYFAYLYTFIPKPTVFPILIFIGLEITAQSFQATKRAHYPAVVLACVPALAALTIIYVDKIFGDLGAIRYVNEAGETLPVTIQSLRAESQTELGVVRMLANGFILTSLLWASSLAAVIDRNLKRAAVYFIVAGLFSLIGLIHSPFPDSRAFLPWTLPAGQWEFPVRLACGYFVSAALLWGWDIWLGCRGGEPTEASESS
jgi:AGZA family xanthine/uracil permease-like MFS transporter